MYSYQTSRTPTPSINPYTSIDPVFNNVVELPNRLFSNQQLLSYAGKVKIGLEGCY
jgi:hypothetical protein